MATELMLGVWVISVIFEDDVGEGVDRPAPVPPDPDCTVSKEGSDSGSGRGGRLDNLRFISRNRVLKIVKSCSDNFSMGFPIDRNMRT
jgi:hypothetical protein